jgi:hypothetical protein
VLAANALLPKIAGAKEILACSHADVVVAPLAAMESLFPAARCRAQVVVLGHDPAVDIERARRLGARAFLASPLDSGLLLRAVRKLLRQAEEPLPLSA